jgi:uncharacterized LabA/DUF88 family protein
MKPKEKVFAFVDGQNLHFGTTKCNNCADKKSIELRSMKVGDCSCGTAWAVDLAKFRVYLSENYHVTEAYYFLGYLQEANDELYKEIQKAGFIVVFKEHNKAAKSGKKGNVDTDIVFEMMRSLLEEGDTFSKIMLVSGDGDYKKVVDYLVKKGRFAKVLFPNKKFASFLYKELGSEYYDYLENVKTYVEYRHG